MRTLFLLLLSGSAAVAAPCVSGTLACTEWVVLSNGPARSMVYRTYPLQTKNENITRALVMVHGASRDADNYFRTAVASAFLAGALENTIVVAPRFASKGGSCNDTLADNEVNWPCSGDSWRSGGASAANPKLTSYDLADEILRKLANKAYSVSARAPGYVPVAGDPAPFGTFRDAHDCTTFDKWPYGLLGRSGYSTRSTDDQLKKQAASRPAVYLLGELDILPL